MTIQQPELDLDEDDTSEIPAESAVPTDKGPGVSPLWPLVRYGRVYGAPGK